MDSKTKAKDLVDKCYGLTDVNWGMKEQKKAAKICVDEIIKSKSKPNTNYTIEVLEDIEYWREVLTEIDKL